MVSGLFVKINDDFDLELENLNVIEDFEALSLLKKYGFSVCWYKFGQNIQVILKTVENGETEIFLAEKNIDAESILNAVINELVEDFEVTTDDQQYMVELLRKHGCCYF